jgi:hypothetical protein
MAECLTNIEHDGSARSQLAMMLSTIAIEHGISLRVLVSMENLASAVALLRVQFETVTRALWLHFAASDERIDRFAELIVSRSLKEPANVPSMQEMLDALGKTAPSTISKMLGELKQGAWGPLNSYVHAGIHPLMQAHHGFPPEYALQSLRNANGLSTMAAILMAVLSGDREITRHIREIQLAHLECLPPLRPSDEQQAMSNEGPLTLSREELYELVWSVFVRAHVPVRSHRRCAADHVAHRA